MASQYDDGDSKYRNGEGYGHRRGEIRPPEAESVLFDLRDGQVGPLIELANGFHVIRLVHRDYAGRMSLDEKVQTRIRDKLKEETMSREYKSFVNKLRAKATIQYSTVAPQ
jgi:parvulin-like peptidyl-prolyl isomerase